VQMTRMVRLALYLLRGYLILLLALLLIRFLQVFH